jgi:hypothetical protein
MVIQFDNGELEIAIQSDLRMAPKVTTYYVNIYKNAIDNRPIIGNILHENKEDAEQVSSHDCTYVKTISFELEQ